MRQLRKVQASLIFGTLSIVVGLIGAWSEERKYYLVALVVLSAILCLLLLRRWRDIPVSGTRYLDQGKADVMVAKAVTLTQYPICTHLSVSHATGVAVGTLAARTVLASIKHFEDMLDERQNQMRRETDFTADVVLKHLNRLRRIQAILTGLLSPSNCWMACYLEIEEAHPVFDALDTVRRRLEEDIVDSLEAFYRGIPRRVGRHYQDERWGPRIQRRICSEIPQALVDIQHTIKESAEPAGIIVEKLEIDWQRNIAYLHRDRACMPGSLKNIRRDGAPYPARLAI